MNRQVKPVRSSAWALALATAALLCLCASTLVMASSPPPASDQLLVTSANSNGGAVLDLNISPSSPNPPFTPKILNTTTQLNSVADAKTHGAFDALVWVSNPYCKTLDLIVADATKGQIVRYPGPTTQSLANCYTTTGSPTVNATAQSLFTWVKPKAGQPSPGPAQPNALSVDSHGNLFVVSSSGLFDPKPSVWVLPFNAANGTYGTPLLIDNRFGGVLTLALAETLIAPTKTSLWNAGDLLVLVGDSFDARLTVYSQSAIYANAATGVVNTASKLNLSGPSSVAIPFAKFLGVLAAPFGMDIWPATAGTNSGVLFTTVDGRILRFDTVQNKFVANFASGLGLGLEKLKVGTYDNVPYAFVAQVQARNTGQILAFAAPPASGVNKPLAAVTTGFMNPLGLAVASSATVPVPTGCTSCSVSPLGPVATTFFTPPPGSNFTGTITEQLCTVDPDPRTSSTIVNGVLTSWSCTALGSPAPALPIGTGTIYCPSFPAAVIPGSVCGHSGPDARGLAVIEGTALGLDPVDNNTFFATPLDIDAALPGPGNLECANFAQTHQIPLTAWGTRSDLTTVEGNIPEDTFLPTEFPNFGGANGYLAESTTACDTSTSGSHGISIFAFGLALSNTTPAYVYSLQNEKSASLLQTVETAIITGVDSNNIPVQTQLENDINTVNQYVSAAQNTPSTQTANLDCALNEIYATDSYLRTALLTNASGFSSSLNTVTGGGDTDPAGAIDSGLANWYTTLNTEILLNPAAMLPAPPYAYPLPFPVPAAGVPQCQGQPQLYSVTASVTGLTGSGLQLQDSFSNSALSFSGTDPVVAASSNGNFTFPTVLASGTTYNVTVANQPSGQTCTAGTGNVTNANVTVTVSCGAAAPANPVINYFTLGYITDTPHDALFAFGEFDASNAVQCNVAGLYGNNATPYYYEITSTSVGNAVGYSYSNFTSPDPPSGPPAYGTDTYVLTCYGAAGTTPATAHILNATGAIPETSTPLSISVFTQDTSGDLSWTTLPAPNAATCTIIDEFGGTLPGTITVPPAGITSAILGLPGSTSCYTDANSGVPQGAVPALVPDTLTLTCSDPNYGTAVATIPWNGGGGSCLL